MLTSQGGRGNRGGVPAPSPTGPAAPEQQSPATPTTKPRKKKPAAAQTMGSLAAQLPQQPMQRLPGGNLAGQSQPFFSQQAPQQRPQQPMMGMSPQLGGTSLPGNGTTGLPGTGTTGAAPQGFGGMQGMASAMSQAPQMMAPQVGGSMGGMSSGPMGRPMAQPPQNFTPQTMPKLVNGVVQGNGVQGAATAQQWQADPNQAMMNQMYNVTNSPSGRPSFSARTGADQPMMYEPGSQLGRPAPSGMGGATMTPERQAVEDRVRQFAMSGQQMPQNNTGMDAYLQNRRTSAGPYG